MGEEEDIERQMQDLEDELAEAEELLAEKPETWRDTVRALPFYLVLIAVILGVVWLLHRLFPDMRGHDVEFWAYMIVLIPLAIGSLAFGMWWKKRRR